MTIAIQAVSSTESSSAFSGFLLGKLRVAYKRSQLFTNELAAVGVALRAGWLDADNAVAHLDECGLADFVLPPEHRHDRQKSFLDL